MQITDQPENLSLFSYDLNDRLNDPEVFQSKAYDLIHSRFIVPGVKRSRWSSYIRDMRVLLRPGGWIQMVEYQLHIQSDTGQLTDQSAVYRWWHGYSSSMATLNRDPRVGPRLQQLMDAERLRDTQTEYMRLPVGGWHPGTCRLSCRDDSQGPRLTVLPKQMFSVADDEQIQHKQASVARQ
jgi:hypothetical protein